MMAVLALAWATNVTAAGDTPQNVASEGMSLWAKIAKTCKITGADKWYGYRRTKFNFKGRNAWVVEPSVAPVLLLYGGQDQTVPPDRKCFDNFFAQYSFLWYYIGGLSGPEEI